MLNLIAKIRAYFAGHHIGDELAKLRAEARAEYDLTINEAHGALFAAEANIQHVAHEELETIEGMLAAMKRRVEALHGAHVLMAPDAVSRAQDLWNRVS